MKKVFIALLVISGFTGLFVLTTSSINYQYKKGNAFTFPHFGFGELARAIFPEQMKDKTPEIPNIPNILLEHIYSSGNITQGIIGTDKENPVDNPGDNVFHIQLDENQLSNKLVWLEYDVYGVKDFTSVCKGINDNVSYGGRFVQTNNSWSSQREQINLQLLKKGKNVIRFSIAENAGVSYKIRNVKLRVQEGSNLDRELVINQPNDMEYFDKYAYITGFVSGTGAENAVIVVDGKTMRTHLGVFEGIINRPGLKNEAWDVQITAMFKDGTKIQKWVSFKNPVSYTFFNSMDAGIAYNETEVDITEGINLTLNDFLLTGEAGSLSKKTTFSVTGLRYEDMPAMGPGMVNVTRQGKGFRLLPHNTLFDKNLKISIPYDTLLIPKGYRAMDIRTFYFDETINRWIMLTMDTVDQGMGVAIANTNHFTDFVNAIIKSPEAPQTNAYTPTSIKDLKAANPLSEINVISPPTANNSGTANQSYPIEIPAGRQGMQPQLAISYSSDASNSWLGQGWDLNLPSISVETRWGVPLYSTTHETESYLVAGEQLLPLAHRSAPVTRNTTNAKKFEPRVEGAFSKIERYGTTPKTYWWKVTDRNGVSYYYGKYANSSSVDTSCIMKDAEGNIAYWALAEVRDLDSNSVRYAYQKVYTSGLSGGTVQGHKIYPLSISYTGFGASLGLYKVEFELDALNLRPDVTISARYGFKEVSANRLKMIKVKYDNNIIRAYYIKYRTSYFNKSLVCAIVETTNYDPGFESMFGIELNCDRVKHIIGEQSFTKIHSFDYYDDLTLGFSAPVTIPSTVDQQGRSLFSKLDISDVTGMTISSASSIGGGGSLDIGFGSKVNKKTQSVGGKYNYSSDLSETMLAHIDMNGDGLPDKVFKKNNKIYYRKMQWDGSQIQFSGTPVMICQVSNLPLGKQNSSTDAWGLEGHVGITESASINGAGDHSTTTTQIPTYFADVNADGLPDLISNGLVYFNSLNPSNDPMLALRTSDTVYYWGDPCNYIIYDGQINDSLIPTKGDNQYIFSQDVVKMWYAPYTDSIKVYAPIRLIEDTSIWRRSSKFVDGVRYSIQHNDQVKTAFSDTISKDNYQLKNTDTLRLWVTKGDRLYFRLQAIKNRSFDNVAWAPEIYYNNPQNKDLTHADADGKKINAYKASEDYFLNSPMMFMAPYSGTIRVRGSVTAPAQSDTVRIQLVKGKTVILERVFADNTPINTYINESLNVLEDDTLTLVAKTNTVINYPSLSSNVMFYYTAASGITIDTASEFSKISIKPLVQCNLYAYNVCPSTVHIIAQADGYTAVPIFSFKPGVTVNAPIFMAIKSEHKLLAKTTFDIVNNTYSGVSLPFTTTIANQKVFFEFTSTDKDLKDKIDASQVTFGGNNYNAGLHTPWLDSLWKFGPLYRGWGQFTYKPDDAALNDPIDEGLLYLIPSNLDTNNLKIDSAGVNSYNSMMQAFANKNIVDNKDKPFNIMYVNKEELVWRGYGDFNMVTATHMSNSRLDPPDSLRVFDSPIPIGIPGQPALAIIKQSWQDNKSYSISGGTTELSASGCFTESENETEMDFMDLNGDGYPDLVSKECTQYTNARGGLAGLKYHHNSLPNSNNYIYTNKTLTNGYGASIGSTFPISKTVKTSQNPKIGTYACSGSATVSASGNTGDNQTQYTLMDVNGDGLPDKVSPQRYVALNLGYAFTNFEPWNLSQIQKGKSNSGSVSLGAGSFLQFTKFENSWTGGISFSGSESKNRIYYMDLNADGLVDLINCEDDTTLKVSFNLGNRFASPVTFASGVEAFVKTYTVTGNGSLAATVGIPINIFGITIKICINPQVYGTKSFSLDKAELRDMNNDGYPDLVYIDDNNNLKVRYSQLGKSALLKKIYTPVGSTYEMDYSLTLSSTNMPQRKWVMSTVKVYDGHRGDGADEMQTNFAYENGYYNRSEKTFIGFETVTSSQINTQAATPYTYRKVVDKYYMNDFLFKGLKKSESIQDSLSKKYVETVYTYNKKEITTGKIVYDSLAHCFGYYYPAISAEDKYFYEGGTNYQIHTRKEYVHGEKGNVVIFRDKGDVNIAEDSLTCYITWKNDTVGNLLSMPTAIEIKHGSTLLRSRIASYTSKGKMNYMSVFDGNNWSATHLSYDTYGNLQNITFPENLHNEMMSYNYTYDNFIHTYPVEVSDVLGHASYTDYDYRYGKPLATYDLTGNTMQFEYYQDGKLKLVRAPNEVINSLPYTIKFDYWDHYGTTSLPDDSIVRWAKTRHYDPMNAGNEITTVTFTDGLGRVIQTKKKATIYDADGSGGDLSIVSGRVAFDAFGRQVMARFPITEKMSTDSIFNYTANPIAPSYTYYDAMDRAKIIVLPDLSTNSNVFGFVNDSYGKKRFLTTSTDANGISATVLKDARGLQTNVIAPLSTLTKFEYSPMGELLKSIDPEGNETSYQYDILGRLVQRVHPDAGTNSYTYDGAGNLLTMQTTNLANNNQYITYDYEFNRLMSVTYPQNPENNVYYEYGPKNSGNQTGRITKVQDASGVQEFTYGKIGEITENIHTFVLPGGQTYSFAMNWEYDSWNRIKNITYPDGEVVSYGYDNGGKLKSMNGQKGNNKYSYIKSIDYDEFESRKKIVYGNNNFTTYNYDPLRRRLTNLVTTDNSGNKIQELEYNYDNESNITAIQNSANPIGNMGGNYSYSYTYDNLYRLTAASGSFTDAGSQAYPFSLAMTYSPSGNITNKELTADTWLNGNAMNIDKADNYFYNGSQPHAISNINTKSGNDIDFTWDANGNMINYFDHSTNFNRNLCWDEENRLKTVRDENYLSSYIYDAGGERAWKLTGAVQRMWINGQNYYDNVELNNRTLYTSSYLVFNEQEYSKHYYIEGERVSSKLGGGFQNSLVNPESYQVTELESDYNTIASSLLTMLQRDFTCAGIEPEQVTLDQNMAVINQSTHHDNPEHEQYFYHTDHLGSSSFISDLSGTITQHLQYLPFGETFIEQQNTSNYYTPYKFSAKEKDEETGYSYFGARYYSPEISVWLSVDPMADQRSWISPYSYCQNSPIIRVDPSGALDNPIYDVDGNLLGTDDKGLQGKAIIMDKSKFSQGMKHEDAMKNSLGYKGLKDDDAKTKFSESYKSLSSRPDYDGQLTVSEANEWYRTGGGKPLYVDASQVDLTPVYKGDINPGESKYVNYASPGNANLETGLVYGTIKLTVLNANGDVKLGGANGLLDTYNFDYQKGRHFRNVATWMGKKNAGSGIDFNIYNYGSGRLFDRPVPITLPPTLPIH